MCIRDSLFVAAHVDVVVIVPAICEPVDDPGVAVEGKDHGHSDGKQVVELFIGKAMRMLGGWLQRHDVDYIDHAHTQVGDTLFEQADSGERFHGGNVTAAGHDDFWIFIRRPGPDTQASGAMRYRLVDGEPLWGGLLTGNDEIDVVAAAQAVVGDREQRVRVGWKVDAHHVGFLVEQVIDCLLYTSRCV